MAKIVRITDFEAPELDVYARLSENQLLRRDDPAQAMFIAESPRVIERALDAGYVPVSCLVDEREAQGQTGEVLARCGEIPVYTAPFAVLTQLTGFALTRGMLCAMKRKPLPTAEQVCCGARRIAVLENVVNPTNVGAIFRSAAALNMDAVLLTRACSNPLYRRAIRVSMGTVFQIPWTFLEEPSGHAAEETQGEGIKTVQCTDDKKMETYANSEGSLLRTNVARLHELGFCTAAMALCDDSVSIDDPRLRAQERLAIILGTEGEGLAAQTIAESDFTIRIPMMHGVDSLNVAAASAVAFWELGKLS